MPSRPRTSRRSQRKTKREKTGPVSDKPHPARPRALHYKVVELSTVDERALEETVNHWVHQGWHLDGVQFAMRESSKRPSMAFVFFTQEGEPLQEQAPEVDAARAKLHRLAAAPEEIDAAPEPIRDFNLDERTWAPPQERSSDPWRRLEQLADEGDEQP